MSENTDKKFLENLEVVEKATPGHSLSASMTRARRSRSSEGSEQLGTPCLLTPPRTPSRNKRRLSGLHGVREATKIAFTPD